MNCIENYFGFQGNLSNWLSRFDSIQNQKPDVKKDQIRLQLLGLLNRFFSVGCLADDLQVTSFCQRRPDKLSKRGKLLTTRTRIGDREAGFFSLES